MIKDVEPLLKECEETLKELMGMGNMEVACYVQGFINSINKLPDAEERPHGEWKKGREIAREMLADETLHIDYENFTCSNCGLVLDRLLYHVDGSPFYNFCPNCGARMRKEGDKDV